MSRDMFLELLFDRGQSTCFTASAKGTSVTSRPGKDDVFFSINALHPTEDLAPSMPYHAPDKPRRADANVVCFRNFLIEIDDMPLNEQFDYVYNLIPFSTAVYSGGKSMHFVISLDQPCKDYNEYMEYVDRLYKYIDKLDPACKNPSRLSRLPNAVRIDTGKKQSLHFLGKRVCKYTLDKMLPYSSKKFAHATNSDTQSQESRFMPVDILEVVRSPQKKILHLGGRNVFFFWLGKRLREFGYENERIEEIVNQAYERVPDTSGFPLEEAYQAARIF